jgi:hypothetical protein
MRSKEMTMLSIVVETERFAATLPRFVGPFENTAEVWAYVYERMRGAGYPRFRIERLERDSDGR